MTSDSAGPFSRPLPLHRIVAGGVDASVEADAAEREALAADLDLPAIHRLEGRYRLTGTAGQIHVVGRVTAEVEQTCGVTLEPFPVKVDEDVEVTFAPPAEHQGTTSPGEIELTLDRDLPEELTGNTVDLGTITAEFLALGLDPFPRKPGVVFEPPPEAPVESAFARLAELRPRGSSD